jgi:microcystin-dependent protein
MAFEPYIGEISVFAGNFPPRGWAFCDGQLLSIAQNTALFAILGTTYGGNGQTTFGLPDLRGRAPLHAGQGPGLSGRLIGEAGGQERVVLSAAQMPAHTHSANGSPAAAAALSPGGNVWAAAPAGGASNYLSAPDAPSAVMAAEAVGLAGGGQGHENMQPYLGVNFIIAMEGVFPPRN